MWSRSTRSTANTDGGINIDTCEIAPFPGSDFNNVHHNNVCSDTSSGSIALGGNSNGNDVHHNVARRISVFGFNNNVHHNTTQVAIVDSSGGNSVHDNTVDPEHLHAAAAHDADRHAGVRVLRHERGRRPQRPGPPDHEELRH